MFQKLSIFTGLLAMVFTALTFAPADARHERSFKPKNHPRTPISCATSKQLRELSGHKQDNVRYNCEDEVEKLTIRQAIDALSNSEIFRTDDPRDGFLVRFPGDMTFDNGSAFLRYDLKRTLHRFARVINDYDNNVTVNGHASTPDIKTTLYPSNQVLSEVRAWNVSDYMINELNVNKRRLSNRGYGEEYPYNVETDEETERMNRRVDFFVEN